jgi:hypothetical protein
MRMRKTGCVHARSGAAAALVRLGRHDRAGGWPTGSSPTCGCWARHVPRASRDGPPGWRAAERRDSTCCASPWPRCAGRLRCSSGPTRWQRPRGTGGGGGPATACLAGVIPALTPGCRPCSGTTRPGRDAEGPQVKEQQVSRPDPAAPPRGCVGARLPGGIRR